jgi:hypothetical protein
VLGNVVIRGEDISVSGLGLGEARPVSLVQPNRGRSSRDITKGLEVRTSS